MNDPTLYPTYPTMYYAGTSSLKTPFTDDYRLAHHRSSLKTKLSLLKTKGRYTVTDD